MGAAACCIAERAKGQRRAAAAVRQTCVGHVRRRAAKIWARTAAYGTMAAATLRIAANVATFKPVCIAGRAVFHLRVPIPAVSGAMAAAASCHVQHARPIDSGRDDREIGIEAWVRGCSMA